MKTKKKHSVRKTDICPLHQKSGTVQLIHLLILKFHNFVCKLRAKKVEFVFVKVCFIVSHLNLREV